MPWQRMRDHKMHPVLTNLWRTPHALSVPSALNKGFRTRVLGENTMVLGCFAEA
jgi:hypothetical protein